MYAVPSDTQLLVFFVPLSTSITREEMDQMEIALTEKTGIPCIVLQKWVRDVELETGDFDVRYLSAETRQNAPDQSNAMFSQKSKNKCTQGENQLPKRDSVGLLRNVILFHLNRLSFLVLGVFLGVLLGSLFHFIFISG